MDEKEFKVALAKFTRIRNLYRQWSGAFHYTDGVACLAENAGAE